MRFLKTLFVILKVQKSICWSAEIYFKLALIKLYFDSISNNEWNDMEYK